MLISAPMNLLDLTITQLKRAAAIKEQIEDLNKELRGVLSGSAKFGPAPQKKRTMSASTRRKIAAAQKRRLANVRRANPATPSVKPTTNAKKKTMSPAARAKLSSKLKAFWAAKKAGKK